MGTTPNDLKPSNATLRVEGYMEAGSLIARVVNQGEAGLDDDKFQKLAQSSSGWNDYQRGKQLAKWGTGEPLKLQFSEVPSADYESKTLAQYSDAGFSGDRFVCAAGCHVNGQRGGRPRNQK